MKFKLLLTPLRFFLLREVNFDRKKGAHNKYWVLDDRLRGVVTYY